MHLQDRMARTKWTTIDPDYRSDNSGEAPADVEYYDPLGAPNSPSDNILDESEDVKRRCDHPTI